jgi:cytochrome c551/c552
MNMKGMTTIMLAAAAAFAAAAMAATDATPTSGTAAPTAKAPGTDKVAESLMKKSDCFTCHQVKRKVVGPAYVDVAKKYKGQKGAVTALVKKVKEGGSGNWGSVPMVAHPDLNDEDVKLMVQWVLSRK